jgi:nucleotide-binding universal stress UspA family protein
MLNVTNILYATDFSDLSIHAMKCAEYLAGKLSARLHCLHVVDDTYQQFWMMAEMPAVPVGPSMEEVLTASKRQLETFVAAHLSPDVQRVEVVRRGKPFLEIINYARDNHVDLIVLGTHGRTALRQVLMGSVADKVVRKSPCPVLTVRSPEHGFQMP